jgi:hypothetical protein
MLRKQNSYNYRHITTIDLRLDNIYIKQVEIYKYLGVIVDCNLPWNPQIDKLCKKYIG